MAKALGSYLNFLWAGLVKQGQTGGVMPSQRFLIDQMISPIPTDYAGELVELGAGTGALTLRLAARCPQARIVACEINPRLAKDLRRALEEAGVADRVKVFEGAAEALLAPRSKSEKTRADYIVSGIPLGTLPRDKANHLIDVINRSLRQGGMYIQFQHSLIDQQKIRLRFSRLRTRPVLLNFPPAFVYFAVKECASAVS